MERSRWTLKDPYIQVKNKGNPPVKNSLRIFHNPRGGSQTAIIVSGKLFLIQIHYNDFPNFVKNRRCGARCSSSGRCLVRPSRAPLSTPYNCDVTLSAFQQNHYFSLANFVANRIFHMKNLRCILEIFKQIQFRTRKKSLNIQLRQFIN